LLIGRRPPLTLAILPDNTVAPFRAQLLKWVGNKQRFAHEIISHFPARFGAYHEPFLGAGGVMGALAPPAGFASDACAPLMQIWACLKQHPQRLVDWYAERWRRMLSHGKEAAYAEIKARYNAKPNPADFLFLARACYGGVVRFRKTDGFMSTPCGAHRPISPGAFAERVKAWHPRVQGVTFRHMEFAEAMRGAQAGDLVYCDPPYSFSQAILYGAQSFSLDELFREIGRCKRRGVLVALSIDGSKKSGGLLCDLRIPDGLFAREVTVNLGRSMLKRFQMEGRSLEREQVADRLLLTF
jgi:DNA adenine methylase